MTKFVTFHGVYLMLSLTKYSLGSGIASQLTLVWLKHYIRQSRIQTAILLLYILEKEKALILLYQLGQEG